MEVQKQFLDGNQKMRFIGDKIQDGDYDKQTIERYIKEGKIADTKEVDKEEAKKNKKSFFK